MSEAPEELKSLIARAGKAGAGPERLASVRTRLEAQLGPLDAARPAPAASAPLPVGPRALVGIAVVVAIGLATWIGTRSTPEPAPVVPAPIVAAPSEPASEPAAVVVPASPSVPVPEAPSVVAPSVQAPGPVERRSAERAPSPSVTAERAEIDAPVAETAPTDPRSSLREEIALLDRALRASESGDPAGARAALAEHRARFPSGTLTPERERMWAELDAHGPPE